MSEWHLYSPLCGSSPPIGSIISPFWCFEKSEKSFEKVLTNRNPRCIMKSRLAERLTENTIASLCCTRCKNEELS